MKSFSIMFFVFFLVSCGKSEDSTVKKPERAIPNINTEIAAELSYPNAFQLEYKGQIVADLGVSGDTVTPYGTFRRGRTLNVLTIEGHEVLVYGEDGVFATECEPHADYPTHGPLHPRCGVSHAESFDNIIVCLSTVASTPIMTAQNWPGVIPAMTDASLGMECWSNGVKMVSNKIFTY
jgi:hypothetical protein